MQHPDNIVRDNRGRTPRYVLEQNRKGIWLLRDQIHRKVIKTWPYKPTDQDLRNAFQKSRVVIRDE
jgi:hypothetical protein